MIRKTEGNLITVSFESIHEAVDFLKNTERTNFYQNYHLSDARSEERTKFSGTKSFEEAMELLLHGWNQGAETLNTRLTTANKQDAPIQVSRTIYDVAGYQACVPRYLQGIPTNMINRRTVTQKQKVVDVVRDIGYAGSIKAETMLNKGLEALNVVNTLEKQGTRCNLYVSAICKNNMFSKKLVNIQIRIKSSTQRLNVKQIAFPLAHPAFFRRIVFGLIERLHETKDNGAGYGSTVDLEEAKQCFHNTYFLYRKSLIDYSELDKLYIK